MYFSHAISQFIAETCRPLRMRVYAEQEATSKLEALHDVLSGAETLV